MKKTVLGILAILILASAVYMIILQNGKSNIIELSSKDEIIRHLEPVNNAISNLSNAKKGTIIAEYSGSFMPGGTISRDELYFEKTNEGIYYKMTEIPEIGNPTIVEDVVATLPNYAEQLFPKQRDKKSLEASLKMIITENTKGKEFKIHWISEGYSKNVKIIENFSKYCIDKKGHLTKIVHCIKYNDSNGDADDKIDKMTLEFIYSN